jgi:hypothetical protein
MRLRDLNHVESIQKHILQENSALTSPVWVRKRTANDTGFQKPIASSQFTVQANLAGVRATDIETVISAKGA